MGLVTSRFLTTASIRSSPPTCLVFRCWFPCLPTRSGCLCADLFYFILEPIKIRKRLLAKLLLTLYVSRPLTNGSSETHFQPSTPSPPFGANRVPSSQETIYRLSSIVSAASLDCSWVSRLPDP